jgi:hypothetical protein
MRNLPALVVLILLTVPNLSREALGESGEVRCPAPGSQFTFSDGGSLESVGDVGGNICRFRNLRTKATFDRLLGAFSPTFPLVRANLDKFRALIPLEVGRRIKFDWAGAGDRGSDGTWFYEVSVERLEQVSTPAGSFSAFVILYDEQTTQTTHGRWQRRYWYSPQVSHIVKFQFQTIHGNPPTNYPRDWILNEFKAPAAASR